MRPINIIDFIKGRWNMKICFIMNSFSLYPSGGAKMIFEYANRLSERGHEIQILYLNHEAWKKYHLPETIRKWLVTQVSKISPTWFSLDKKIEHLSLYDKQLEEKTQDTNVFIVTAVTTVNISREIFKNRRFAYFIQGYENWFVSDQYVQDTYKLGMTNIVVSEWLKRFVDKYSNTDSILIKNPIDLNKYKIMTPIDERKPHSIGVLYHTQPEKGLKYAIGALKRIKKDYPDLSVYMFGVPNRPNDFPAWIHYTKKASQEQTIGIYNEVSVWLCATMDEGYGLTGLEAMACGDVLVSTAYKGVFEYAENEENALLSPVKDISSLVKNVERVFEDRDLKYKLIQNAQKSIKNFSWDKAVDKFEKALMIENGKVL
jgi:glycosyltransferase involved in cell wall biosynthesis